MSGTNFQMLQSIVTSTPTTDKNMFSTLMRYPNHLQALASILALATIHSSYGIEIDFPREGEQMTEERFIEFADQISELTPQQVGNNPSCIQHPSTPFLDRLLRMPFALYFYVQVRSIRESAGKLEDPHLTIPVASDLADSEQPAITIEILDDGTFLIDGEPRTLAQIPKRPHEQDKASYIRIIAPKETLMRNMKSVLQAANAAGYQDVVFSAKPSE